MRKRRVVVTGLGMVCPVGNDVESAWKAILGGKSGIETITHFDASQLSVRICGAVKNFDESLALTSKDCRKMDLFIQYAIEAARQAFIDSNLKIDESLALRAGVAVGSGIGGLPMIEKAKEIAIESGPRRISPFFIPAVIINMAAGHISIRHHLKGPNIAIVTACTTGTHNIGHAARMIEHGDADVMVAGGSEMASTELGIGGFASARALSMRNDEPHKASRPWDKDRDGFVLGEGAGIVILEELEHAKARGAKIYAEYRGFGMSADAYHMTGMQAEGEGGARCMTNALRDAGLEPTQIDYINAHGTSTPLADPIEIKAIKSVFGKHAYELAVSSTKSMTGHLLGAAGAIEAIFSILAIRDQIAPPTINLDNPDEGCDLNLVPHKAQAMKMKVALSNSFGFGGTNGCIIFSRYER